MKINSVIWNNKKFLNQKVSNIKLQNLIRKNEMGVLNVHIVQLKKNLRIYLY